VDWPVRRPTSQYFSDSRKAPFVPMLDAREHACTAMIRNQPFETTGVQNKLK
jgi:hypothetical protein